MIAEIGAAAVTIATKEALTPIIKSALGMAAKAGATATAAFVSNFTNQFSEYIQRQLNKHLYLSVLVFQNHSILLEDIYIPLTLARARNDLEGDRDENIRVSAFCAQVFKEHKRILLTDTAGMGKSTLMKYLFIQCVRSNFSIPIFIELRHLSKTQTIIQLLERELNYGDLGNEVTFNEKNIAKILKAGKMVFFLDGYDEIPSKDREFVTKDVKSFIEAYSENYFAITSRPESGLPSFPSFTQFKIRPLENEESFELIRKYDRNGPRSTQLIERLQGKELLSVHEFLKNPLLTSLLYRCFEYKQSIPNKKHIFYRQVFDALFDWHDSSKDGYNTRDKRSKLDLDSFHRVLRVVGFISTVTGEIEGETDKVLGWIREAKAVCAGLVFAESDFLEDLIRAVPVFSKDGIYYRWAHKSMAEYFAAQYICTEGKSQQKEFFALIMSAENPDRFFNFLDQVYDVDLAAFRKYFSLPLAKAFTEFRNSSYKNMDTHITSEQIELRKATTFANRFSIVLDKAFDDFEFSGSISNYFSKNEMISINSAMIMKSAASTPTSVLLVMMPTPFSMIANLLSSKKDVLTVNAAFQPHPPSTVRKFIGLKKRQPYPVSDDPTNSINKVKNFDLATNYCLRLRPVILDGDACRTFCENFSDETQQRNFTAELFKSMK